MPREEYLGSATGPEIDQAVEDVLNSKVSVYKGISYASLLARLEAIENNLGVHKTQHDIDGTDSLVEYYQTKQSKNIKEYGATGNGSTNEYEFFNAMITDIDGADYDVVLPKGIYKIATNITIPSNIRLIFANGAILKPANGVVITGSNAKIEAGLYQIFDLSLGGTIAGTWDIKEVYPEWFGAVGDGVVDDTAVFAKMMNSLDDTKRNTIYLTQNYYTSILVNKRNVTIVGGGTITGSVTIDTPLVGNTQPDSNFRIQNVEFEKGADNFAIRFIKARVGKISNIDVSNDFTYAIYYNESSTYSQKTAKITISQAWLRGDYGIYLSENNFALGAADMQVSDCQFYNNITNIHLFHVDGFIESNNTMFLPGSNSESVVKERNIYADYINWGKFGSGSNYFEAGLESIYMSHFQNTIINNLSIAWCGQRIASSGIKLVNGDVSDGEAVISSVNNITIMFPTLHGIETDEHMSDLSINDIVIRSAGVSSYYYGVENLSAMDHYGIYVPVFDSDQNVSVENILSPQNECSITSRAFARNIIDSKNRYDISRLETITSNSNTLALTRGSLIYNISNSNATNIDTISGDFYTGQEITLVAYNGNTTLVHDASKLALYDKKNLNLQIYTSIRLMYAGSNRWVQIGGCDLDLRSSTTYNPPNLTAGQQDTTTLTVTGAALGDFAVPSFSVDLTGVQLTAYVSATDTVTCRFLNLSGADINLASGTLKVKVIKS
jgi:hypothetical protein